jgi:glycosyltransferase involved in cell wall biosynthesis/SAM-dependent methyltransferase
MKSTAQADPLVSVVTIFRDAERFLDEAIRSVFRQIYSNWELLLVDDGSADSSSRLATRWAEQNPRRVRYLTHPDRANHGMSASRNLGVQHAHGAYVAFLDADDVWLPAKLAEQVAILESQPEVAMIYGLSQWWYSWTGRLQDEARDFVHPLGVPPGRILQPPELVVRFFLRQDAAIPSPSSILVRRSIIDRVNGFEDAFTGLYEDQAFYSKICLQAPIIASDTCWARYRQHPDSSVSNADRAGKAYSARLTFLNWLAAYIQQAGMGYAAIEQALQGEIWRCRHPRLHRLVTRAGHARLPLLGVPFWRIGRRIIPALLREWVLARLTGREYRPPPGWVHLGHLRRLRPIGQDFGFGRGLPVDRYYIEQFLATHADDIRGRVLEIADDTYARRFGGNRVTSTEVLHVTGADGPATIVADLTDASNIASASFDCVILTQTLQFIYDVRRALATVQRILRPGGVVLATLPGITQISRYDMERWGQFWSFTTLSAQHLFAEVFPMSVQVEAYGNVLAAVAFLHGLASHEIGRAALDHGDPDYQLIIGVRAAKPHVAP